jgi:hypothetical protein
MMGIAFLFLITVIALVLSWGALELLDWLNWRWWYRSKWRFPLVIGGTVIVSGSLMVVAILISIGLKTLMVTP